MKIIEKLKEEHEEIERELLELETIINDSKENLNTSNRIHTLKKLYNLWDTHETQEEKVFSIFERERIKVPVEIMRTDHIALKPHKEKLEKAIESHQNQALVKSIHTDLEIIIAKFRKHIQMEEEIIYTISPEEFTDEEIKQLEEME